MLWVLINIKEYKNDRTLLNLAKLSTPAHQALDFFSSLRQSRQEGLNSLTLLKNYSWYSIGLSLLALKISRLSLDFFLAMFSPLARTKLW